MLCQIETPQSRGVRSGRAGGAAAPQKLFERGPEYLSAPPKNIYAIILQNIR